MVAAAAALVVAFLAPQVAKADWFDDIVNFVSAPIVTLFGGGEDNGIETLAVENADTVVDLDTTNDWTKFTRPDGQPSTQNVGRIWTDKSVFHDTYTFSGSADLDGQTIQKGDSDFLVGLSALSSMSNLKEMVQTGKPLDIVLVMDVSGSMEDSLVSYEAVYDLETGWIAPNYYILADGDYQEIEHDNRGWYYETGYGMWTERHDVTPKTSADDQSGTQVYVRNNTAKIDALKNAVNGFIDATSNANAAIDDSNNKHRIALVKFADDSFHYTIGNNRGAGGDSRYNYTQVLSDFSTDANDLKNDVNSIQEGGATAADYGMTMAQHVLDGGRYSASGGWFDNNKGSGTYVGARDNAQKVVIFFTDGEPNHSSDWSGSVANDAIDVARELKQSGTLVYSVGVFEDADPSDTNGNFNRYMHGVSSNYPNAQAYNNLGQRTPDSDYYKAASSADELNTIFEDIFEETQEGVASGSPIEENTQQGNTQPGTLTFTDQLGAYMQVTGTGAGGDKMQLAYGDTIYTSDNKTTNGNTDTYHFSGQVEGNAVYGAANLADLVVTVERSNDLAVGDKVTVQLPASLLPLRNYDVDTDNHTMTVAEAYPVRLFYGVSLKAEAEQALNDPTSDVYAAIMGSQKSEDGKTVDFYTNSFVKGAADGSATASFEPNAGNKFYYYTQDTPLYINEDCTIEANEWNSRGADTLYWKDTYWVQTENGGAQERTAGVAVNRGTAEWEAMESTGGYDGTYYIPADTPRSDRPATLTSAKTNNATRTATNVLNPAWAGTSVNQHLGNNGRMSFNMPGSLEIKKTVNWGNASDETQENKNSFTFTVDLNDEEGATLKGSYPYYLNGSDEQAGTVKNGDTITINGGQSVKIEGLPAGTQFTVEEQGANQNGFTTEDASTAEGNDNPSDGTVSGTIVGGDNVSTTFTNTYKAADVNLSTSTTLKVKKDLQNRDWRDTDEFTFEIDGLGNTAGPGITTPEPADTTITVNSQTADYTASFGDITFTAPGEYRYNITEDNDTDPIAGIDYSGASYRVVVTVTDNGTGNLEVSNVAIEQRTNDDGVENNPAVAVQGDTVTFVNKYDADGGTTNIDGTKSYTDATGGNPINADKFTFKIEALGGYDTNNPQTSPYTYGVDETPLPAGSDEATHSKTVYNTGYDFTFGTIAFDGGDIGRTYEYKVTELAQNKDGQTEDGMTYDTKEYTVKVTVTEVTDADGTHIVATPNIAPKDLVFTNTYKPTDVTLGEDGVAPIQGTKTLDGRDMKDGETFYFQLTQTGGPAADGGGFVSVLDQPETVTVGKDNMQSGSADFKFSNLTFSQVGTYTFTVKEVADERGTETANGSGMTYDTNIATVTVVVSDNHDGTLKAEVTYRNDKHADTTDKALFANTYKASMNYGAEGEGGINVTKKMLDRPMANNEFSFTIAGADSSTMGADEANAKLAGADKSFQNTAAAENGTATMAKLQSMSFDQDDAGKTFSYLVSETIPADGDKLVNVAYDQSQYRVDIEVVDNGDGTMHTVTTVTKIKASDGTEASEVVVNHANSDAQDYVAPTFGFVNDYNPTPATVGEDASHQIQVTKHVTGADSAADYTFTLTATGNNISNIEGLDQNNQLTVSTNGTIKDGESQTKTFGELTFTEPGTYTFTVRENQPAADAGWTFDDADGDGATDAHTVTVYVTDRNEDGQYDGNLYIDRVTGSPVEITNSYKADSVVVGGDGAQQQITVKKTVTGADSTADFQFQIEPVDAGDPKWKNVEVVDEDFDALASITEDFSDGNSKNATFAGIKFNAADEYQFKITEVKPENVPAGWTYDTHESIVTVKVTDNGEGQLEASVSYNNTNATTEADKGTTGAAAFTNSYVPGEVTTGTDANTGIQVTKKVTGHDAIESFEFSLNLADGQDNSHVFEGTGEQKTAFDGMTLTTSENIKAGATETYTFGSITFTAAGAYTFVIDEATEKTDDGWKYDTSTHGVTVHVNDQGGQLVITDIEGNNPTFTNSYDHGTVTLSGDSALKVQKTVTGAPTDVDFTFTATFDAEASAAAENPGSIEGIQGDVEDQDFVLNATVSDDFSEDGAPKTADFGDVTFTQSGTYVFNVTETNQGPAEGSGWTYDRTTKTITVTVTDNNNGALEATVSYNNNVAGAAEDDSTIDNAAAFTNSYKAGSVVVGGEGAEQKITVQKTLVDRDWLEDDSFEFVLTAQDDAPMPAGDGSKVTITGASEPKTASFGEITYDTEGTYTYTVSEAKGNLGGVTYDGHTATVKVSVTDTNHDGKLEASVSYDNSAATTEADKNVDNAAAFTNTYDAGETTVDTGTAEVKLTKVLENKVWAGDEFNFKIEAVSNTAGIDLVKQPMPENDQVTVSEPTDKDANSAIFSFGEIKYDTAGTYVYKVTEIPGNNPGITYSANEATVTVVVTDNFDGTYTTGVTIANNKFTNTYASELDFAAAGGLEIVKTFENADMREFSFTVTPADQKSADKLGIDLAGETFTTKTGATIGDDNASHAEIAVIDPATEAKFTQDDADDTYTYTVKETAGSAADVTYDGTTYTVTITTDDDGRGGIKVTTTVTDGAGYSQTYVYDNDAATEDPTAIVPFTNTYKATGELGGNGSVSIKATKTLTNRPMTDGEFTFNVTNASDPNNTVVATGTNAADGTITFGAIDYSIDQMLEDVDNGLATPGVVDGKNTFTYTYQVTEDTTNLDEGVAATDAAGFQITVTVTDNGDGTLGIAVAYPNSGDGLTFRNTYGEGEQGQASLNINGTKQLVVTSGDKAPDITGKYTFTLTGEDGAPMPVKTTATNDASGNVTFGDITYTMENVFGDTGSQDAATNAEGEPALQSAARTKTFTYTVTESGSVEGVDNDTQASKTFTVTVTDNGDGTLSVVTDPAQGALFSFTNTYSVDPTGSSPTGEGGITITKALDGRDLATGEFTFELVDAEGTVVAKGTNDVSGNVEIGEVTFTKPGTFTYTIREVNNRLGGVEYDSARYNVTAEVTDNGNGTLSVEWSFTNVDGTSVESIVFSNTYEADPTTLMLQGVKVLNNGELATGQFSFTMKGLDGAPMPEGAIDGTLQVTNNDDGTINFGTITYEEVGTYTYEITEVRGADENVVYDNETYTVTVPVVDTGDGWLAVRDMTITNSANEAAGLIFTNSVLKPTDPTDPQDPEGTDPWIEIDKKLTGRALKAGEFTFQMRYVRGGSADAVSPKSIVTTNDADGNVIFNQENNTGFTFAQEGMYTFVISEITGDDPSVVYDTAEYTVVANVTRNEGTGELEVAWLLLNADGDVVEENPSITFYNSVVTHPGTDDDPDPSDPSKPDIDVDKKLDGRDMVAGEFSFEIEATGDNADKVTPGRLTGTNDAGGSVSFSGDGFTFSEAGDYEFTVSEVLPADDDPDTPGVQHNGVTYDEATYTITVKVTEVDGKLVVEWDLGAAAAGITFHNTYEPSEVAKVTIGATKVLIGRDLATGEFTFELVDAQGNVVATATNGADGSVYFPTLEFDKAGTYEYTIREVVGSLTGVTYDSTVHSVTVTVVDNGDGTLTATVTYDGGSGSAPVFTNTYKVPDQPGKPEEPSEPERPDTPKIPDAGDHTNVALPAFLAVGGAALIACACLLKLRKSR